MVAEFELGEGFAERRDYKERSGERKDLIQDPSAD